jgi:type I restriction-modification system DNA methylase subunit
MSEYHKRQLQQQLWNIADTLRGKMNADEFRDYILGFIFYKYRLCCMNPRLRRTIPSRLGVRRL